MKRTLVLTILIVCGDSLARDRRPAACPAGTKVVEVEKVKDNLFMLKGGGGNTEMTPASGKDRVGLYYFGRGHTDGDASSPATAR